MDASLAKNNIRSSKNFSAPIDEPLFRDIQEKVSNKLNVPIENQEPPELLHYDKGGFYISHYDDAFFHDTYDKIFKKFNGYRIYTTYIYLNDVDEGGETSFNNLGFKIKPKKGTAIIWRNINNSCNEVHPCSLHEAIPVKSKDKWGLTIWSRNIPPFNKSINYYRYEILNKLNLLKE